MPIESGLWVALPRGVDDDSGRLRLTVMVSPRLRSDADGGSRLAEYPLFSQWTRVVQGLRWSVEVDGVGELEAVPDPASPTPDPAAWGVVFAGDVAVDDHAPRDLSDRPVSSYPVSEVARDLLATYAEVGASSPVAPPRVTTGPLRDFVDDVVWFQRHPEELDQTLDRVRRAERSQVVDGRAGRYLPRAQRQSMGRAGTFGVGQRFYDRRLGGQRLHQPGAPGELPGLPTLPPPEPPRLDFHAYVAALADYPALLRMLGLAVDLVVDDPGLPPTGRLRAVFPDAPADWFRAPATTPWTHFDADLPWFLPRPRHERSRAFSRGQLHFNRELLWVHQIDVDGSLLKVLNAADSLGTQADAVLAAGSGPSMTADAGSLPALRGAGFTVSRDERAADVVEQLDRTVLTEQQVAADAPADLFAEDLYRGYVVDVDKDGQGFASLCRRVGRYAVTQDDGSEVELAVPPDEGYVKGASTTSVPGDDELYLHEALFSWSGWSLVAGRPGQRLRTDETLEDPATPLPHDEQVPLVTSFTPEPGTLAPLRYGSRYRLRARLADLSGATVTGTALDTDEEPSRGDTFLRWEPVPAPVVVPRRAYGEGESQLRMVLRSTLGTGPGDYVALPRVTSLPGHTDAATAYLATDSRWIVPPGTSQQMAERHGVFDSAFGPGATTADVRAAYDVAARESGKVGEVEPGDELATPYLPDVSSRGAAFSVLPGHPAGSSFVQRWPADVGTAWWDRQPFRLELVGGPAPAPATPEGAPLAPEWDVDARVLRLHVPQAEVVRVRLSSALDEDDLQVQGAWDLLAPRIPGMRAQALAGRLWMVSPSLELVLVHAVEKPLAAPVVDVPQSGMLRAEGEHFVALTGVIDNHARSTGRLDVDARWTEQVDDVGMPAPRDGVDGRDTAPAHGHVGGFDLEATEDDCRVGRTDVSGNGLPTRHQLRHELGDTRHRHVAYRARATSRFREYFAPEVATEVEVEGEEEVPRMEHRGAETWLHVPSSRRPAPPQVVSVVPTFTWTESTQLGLPRPGRGLGLSSTTVRRRTCGLRVHLRRPWFSSGDGELLGVVLKRQPWLGWWADAERGFTVPDVARAEADRVAERIFGRGLVEAASSARNPASLRLLRGLGVTTSRLSTRSTAEVTEALTRGFDPIGIELGPLFPTVTRPAPDDVLTRWGADPVQQSPGPAGGPFVHQLGLRTHVAPDVAPAEDPLSRVTVVGHQPFWDADRSLWACDVELPAGAAYTPFVQLALCRFQPWSVPGLEMSPVVRADFAQLLPTRELRVTSGSPLRVSVSGPFGSSGGPLDARRVTARVETRPVGGDDLDWRPLGPTVELAGSLGEAPGSDATWSGRVLPTDAPAGHERRLLVEEHERHPTDPELDDQWGAVTQTSFLGLTFATRERLVYADSVPL